MLTLNTLTDHQRAVVAMPIREGGLGLGGASPILHSAFVGGHGAVIRWLQHKSGWAEAYTISVSIASKAALAASIDAINEVIEESNGELLLKYLDPDIPEAWPKQSDLSFAFSRAAADKHEHDLAQTDPQLASWYANQRLPGAGDFLRVTPGQYHFRVSPQLFRIQVATRLMAPIQGLQDSGTRCDCGYAGRDLQTGVHYISRCPVITMRDTRH